MASQANTLTSGCASLVLHIGLVSVQRLMCDRAFVIDTRQVQIVALDVFRRGNLITIDHLSAISVLAHW